MKNLEKDFFAKHDPDILPILRASVVGIAGAGGLGSNAALTLARAGIVANMQANLAVELLVKRAKK